MTDDDQRLSQGYLPHSQRIGVDRQGNYVTPAETIGIRPYLPSVPTIGEESQGQSNQKMESEESQALFVQVVGNRPMKGVQESRDDYNSSYHDHIHVDEPT